MLSETLPALTQPGDPRNVTPCHTGAAAKVCGRDAALAEVDVDTAELLAVTGLLGACISCGHPYPGHYWGCAQTSIGGAA